MLEQLLFFLLEDPPVTPVVLEVLPHERLVPAPKWLALEILAPHRPVEHVTQQRKISVDGRRLSDARHLLMLGHSRGFLQGRHEVFDIRRPDLG